MFRTRDFNSFDNITQTIRCSNHLAVLDNPMKLVFGRRRLRESTCSCVGRHADVTMEQAHLGADKTVGERL